MKSDDPGPFRTPSIMPHSLAEPRLLREGVSPRGCMPHSHAGPSSLVRQHTHTADPISGIYLRVHLRGVRCSLTNMGFRGLHFRLLLYKLVYHIFLYHSPSIYTYLLLHLYYSLYHNLLITFVMINHKYIDYARHSPAHTAYIYLVR